MNSVCSPTTIVCVLSHGGGAVTTGVYLCGVRGVVCVCVCVRERERERERASVRTRARRVCVCHQGHNITHTHIHTHTHTHTHTHNQTYTQLNTRATRPPPFSTHARTRADHEHQPCGPQRLFAVKPPWRSGSRVCVHVYLYSMYKCTMMTLAVHWTLYNGTTPCTGTVKQSNIMMCIDAVVQV